MIRASNASAVLYMVADDMRPEWDAYCPSCKLITPNIDKLTEGGLLFTRAYCQQAICGPRSVDLRVISSSLSGSSFNTLQPQLVYVGKAA